jgi:hypothetical protein
MDAACGERGFVNLEVTLLCCGAVPSLNYMQYHFPQGFARFVLSAFEPSIVGLEDWQVRDTAFSLVLVIRGSCTSEVVLYA